MLRINRRHIKISCTIGFNVIFSLLAKQALAQAVESLITVDERTITILLPESAYKLNEESVAIELDGYDISAFSRISGNTLEIQLETPLTRGTHALNVNLLLADGEIESLVYHDVYVDRSAVSEGNWNFNATFGSSYLVDHDKNHDYQDQINSHSNATIEFNGEQQKGDWRFSANGKAMYDSNIGSIPDQENWSLPEYHLSSTYRFNGASGTIGVGNINIDHESLLFSSYQRRGAAVDVLNKYDTYQFKLFRIQSDPNTRIDRDLITSNSIPKENVGMSAGMFLPDQRLKVSVGYISGETTLGSSGSVGFDEVTVYGGDSSSLALDSIWMNKSLWMHLEYAQSDFDSDGIGIGMDEQYDNASQIMLQLSSNGDMGKGWFDYWSGSLQHKTVGKDFYSLGNIYLPGDSKLTRLYFNSSLKGIGFEAELAREENNIDNDNLLPTQTHDRTGITINYTPMNLSPINPLWNLIGSPSLMSKLYRSYHYQPDEDAVLAGFDVDNQVNESELNLTFTHPHWNWGLQYQLIEQNDRSNAVSEGDFILYQPPSDQRNKLLGLQFGLMPNERISLNLLLQWSKRLEIDLGNSYRSRNLNLDAFFQLVPNTLTLQFNYNYSGDQSSLKSSLLPNDDFISHTGNTQLTWHALRAKSTQPALDFYFRGSYGKQDNRTFTLVDKQWAAYFGINVHWAAGGQE